MQETLDLNSFTQEETIEQPNDENNKQVSQPVDENKEQIPQSTIVPAKPVKKPTIAHELAKKQRDISIAEFFEKNRHLLGFDNRKKALLTTIKEAVDNSLDACEEAGVLPELIVEITDMGNDRYRIAVEDNGPGILKYL